jgi:hypothetical protein
MPGGQQQRQQQQQQQQGGWAGARHGITMCGPTPPIACDGARLDAALRALAAQLGPSEVRHTGSAPQAAGGACARPGRARGRRPRHTHTTRHARCLLPPRLCAPHRRSARGSWRRGAV